MLLLDDLILEIPVMKTNRLANELNMELSQVEARHLLSQLLDQLNTGQVVKVRVKGFLIKPVVTQVRPATTREDLIPF